MPSALATPLLFYLADAYQSFRPQLVSSKLTELVLGGGVGRQTQALAARSSPRRRELTLSNSSHKRVELPRELGTLLQGAVMAGGGHGVCGPQKQPLRGG